MKFKFYLILTFLFILSFNFINSYEISYTSNDGINFNSVSYYCSLNSDFCLNVIGNPILEKREPHSDPLIPMIIKLK